MSVFYVVRIYVYYTISIFCRQEKTENKIGIGKDRMSVSVNLYEHPSNEKPLFSLNSGFS